MVKHLYMLGMLTKPASEQFIKLLATYHKRVKINYAEFEPEKMRS